MLVHRAQRSDIGVGGHISTYAGAATLYEVGLNHFFRGPDHPGGGDQIFYQGHASPGMYARAYLEGRLSEEDLNGFRQEKSKAPHGLSSYPHPRLMPDFWQFPTVSMGIGPMNAIYQAQFNRYLRDRGIKDTTDQHVWAFLGDGEMDEPESRGLLQLAANEGLDNLTFVINCNLQRLDGPVRGNGKIVQELEAFFRGAGWNVIKVLWGREWDPLFARDTSGDLVRIMNETPGRGFPDLQGRVGQLRPGQLLRQDRGHEADGQGHDRRPDLEHEARRARLPQGVRGLPRRQPARRPADGGAGEDGQGLRAGSQLRGPQRHPPDEEADHRGPQAVPRPPGHPDHRRAARQEPVRGALLPPGRGLRRDPVHPRAAAQARRLHPRAAQHPEAAGAAGRRDLRRGQEGLRQADGGHHDGLRPHPAGPDPGQGHGRAGRADHPRRGPDVRHGLVLPDGQDLQPEGTAVHLGRPRALLGLQGIRARPDPARRDQRGRFDGGLHRRRDRRTRRTASR